MITFIAGLLVAAIMVVLVILLWLHRTATILETPSSLIASQHGPWQIDPETRRYFSVYGNHGGSVVTVMVSPDELLAYEKTHHTEVRGKKLQERLTLCAEARSA
jgi:hypothetical protein